MPQPCPRHAALVGRILAAAALLAPAALPTGAVAGPPIEGLAPRVAECEHAARTQGATRRGDEVLGPLHLPGERGSHWSPATRRFTSKMPLVVVGSRAVTVRVPARLEGRVAMTYGHLGTSGEYTFVPCPGRRATFWPGGLSFTRREPIALLVRVEGWARPRPLGLGVFPPY